MFIAILGEAHAAVMKQHVGNASIIQECSRLFTELMLNQARENERTREYFKKVLVGELESKVDIECTAAIWERFFGEAF